MCGLFARDCDEVKRWREGCSEGEGKGEGEDTRGSVCGRCY